MVPFNWICKWMVAYCEYFTLSGLTNSLKQLLSKINKHFLFIFFKQNVYLYAIINYRCRRFARQCCDNRRFSNRSKFWSVNLRRARTNRLFRSFRKWTLWDVLTNSRTPFCEYPRWNIKFTKSNKWFLLTIIVSTLILPNPLLQILPKSTTVIITYKTF